MKSWSRSHRWRGCKTHPEGLACTDRTNVGWSYFTHIRFLSSSPCSTSFTSHACGSHTHLPSLGFQSFSGRQQGSNSFSSTSSVSTSTLFSFYFHFAFLPPRNFVPECSPLGPVNSTEAPSLAILRHTIQEFLIYLPLPSDISRSLSPRLLQVRVLYVCIESIHACVCVCVHAIHLEPAASIFLIHFDVQLHLLHYSYSSTLLKITHMCILHAHIRRLKSTRIYEWILRAYPCACRHLYTWKYMYMEFVKVWVCLLHIAEDKRRLTPWERVY